MPQRIAIYIRAHTEGTHRETRHIHSVHSDANLSVPGTMKSALLDRLRKEIHTRAVPDRRRARAARIGQQFEALDAYRRGENRRFLVEEIGRAEHAAAEGIEQAAGEETGAANRANRKAQRAREARRRRQRPGRAGGSGVSSCAGSGSVAGSSVSEQSGRTGGSSSESSVRSEVHNSIFSARKMAALQKAVVEERRQKKTTNNVRF